MARKESKPCAGEMAGECMQQHASTHSAGGLTAAHSHKQTACCRRMCIPVTIWAANKLAYFSNTTARPVSVLLYAEPTTAAVQAGCGAFCAGVGATTQAAQHVITARWEQQLCGLLLLLLCWGQLRDTPAGRSFWARFPSSTARQS